MQLTKDDVYEDEEEMNTTRYFDKSYTPKIIKKLDFSKFLEVRKFYEKYKNHQHAFQIEFEDLYEQFREEEIKNDIYFYDWLFFHCFVEGLK